MPHDTILNSRNSPLEIGRITVGWPGGEVGFTLCPGKRQARSVSGHWQRDLDTDLDAIQAWGAHAMVTLMPLDELQAVQADGLGAACEARGLEWHHLPIRDVDVPDAAFEAAWLLSGLRLRAHLRAGRRVLVHCRGGLGRSGTIAARLLVELGWPAREAVAAVRAQRPGAIETRAQEAYVHRLPGAVDVAHDAHAARVLGCLLGGAVGDAFGYAVEFDRWPAIQRRHGPDGLRAPVLHGGRLRVSDDTQMTLFTLEALALALVLAQAGSLRAPDEADLARLTAALRRAYLRWGDTQGLEAPRASQEPGAMLQRRPAMRQLRAPGNTCLSALRAGAPGSTTRPVNDSKGCGGVMRTASIGLLPALPVPCALRLGNAAAALTHGHVDGWLPGGLMAALVRQLLDGAALPDAARHAIALPDVPPGTGSVRLIALALQLAQDGVPTRAACRQLGEGWTGDEALAIALHAALSTDSFEDALRAAANHDGDSDSTASIAGQLLGARDGILAVPHAWARRLDVLDEVLMLAQAFLAQCAAPVPGQAE